MKKTLFVILIAAALVTMFGCTSPSVVVNTTTKVDFSKAYIGTHTAVIPIGRIDDASTIVGVLNAFENQEHVRITSWSFSSTGNSAGVDTGGSGGQARTSLLVTFVRASDETTSTR